MKVLHVINTLSAGGAELHLLTLCRHLKKQGVEAVVACLRERIKDGRSLKLDFEREGIRVVNLEADSRWNGLFVGRVLRLLGREKPDLLHTHLPRADLAGMIARLTQPSILWISSVHDIYSNSWSARGTLPLFNWVWSRSDAVIAISHAVKDWLVAEKNVSSDIVTVVHYGIESEQFAHSGAGLRQTWGLDGRPVVGSIGRLEPRKGHDNLIQAMPSVLERVPNACLLIAGHDLWGYGKSLQARIDGLGLTEQIRLVGFQGNVPSFLHALDVFAFASRSEGFGQVVIEAMAAGKPVVTSRIAPLTEIVVDGETGLLAETENAQSFGDAITWLLTHPDARASMGMLGKDRVRSLFAAEKMARETLAVYNATLSRRARR